MGIYSEKQIFSNLSWYRSNFDYARKSVKHKRKIHRIDFELKKYKNFKHKDPFLYNCSHCGMSTHTNDNYCTNCGSKMDYSNTYDEMIKTFNEYKDEKTIKGISKDYLLSMKDDYYFMNNCNGLLEAIFYVATSHRFDKSKAKSYLGRIRSFKVLTQQLILQDFKNKLFYDYNEIYGYISNWKGYKLILRDDISEVDILANMCYVKVSYTPPSRLNNEKIYNMGIKDSNRELSLGGYYAASMLIFGELVGTENPYNKFEFIDDVLCTKLLAIASSWYYCRVNKKKRSFTPNKRIFWEFVWSCQLNPSDELKLYDVVDCLATE